MTWTLPDRAATLNQDCIKVALMNSLFFAVGVRLLYFSHDISGPRPVRC